MSPWKDGASLQALRSHHETMEDMNAQDDSTFGMEETSESLEHSVFRGLSPRVEKFEACETSPGALSRGVMGALPFVMSGALATSAIATPGLVQHSAVPAENDASGEEARDARPGFADRLAGAMLPAAHAVLSTVRPDLPATYVVQPGDSISAIADSFGIPTPAILTLNGLSWNALLHEGQVLKLSAEPTKKAAASPARVAGNTYIVQQGETLSTIAERLGISTSALTAENAFESSATIYAGQSIRIPGSTAPVVQRDADTDMPALASAPRIIPASATGNDQVMTESDQSAEIEEPAEPAVFDAADIELAEKPALVTVKVPSPAAPVVAKPATPAPKAATPAPKAAAPAPVSPAESEPDEAEPASEVGQPVSGSITPLNDERRASAQVIINVGRELGVSDYGIVIALATAMQESSLRNINWGDRDSVGLFQQRPSSGWGTAEQIMDPAYASRLFYGGPSNPNAGRTRGLLDISGWQSMALTVAAQRVQISAYPDAYAKWEPSAWAWLYELT